MYKLSIPITNISVDRMGREKVLSELKRANADRIFLCASFRGIENPELLKGDLEAMRINIPFFKQEGFEVGVWTSTLGHGGRLSHENSLSSIADYTRITGFKDETRDDSFCPLDGRFASDFCSWIKSIALCGPDMIMLDDDYRLAIRGFIGCCCDLHISEYQKLVGEEITREELPDKIFRGGPNKYRDIWFKMTGETLTDFAAKIRAAVDSADENIRLGFCSAPSSWDLDGTDSLAVTKAFAGKTAPFLRFIGAPYWAANWNGVRLAYTIELERLQRYWCENSGIEIFSEGDAYPRPRFNVPASYIEGYDTALRADGGFDGILKYMLDYVSGPLYETGYIDRHVRNSGLYESIGRYFSGKISSGVNVFETMHLLRNADLPEDYAGDGYISDMVYPTSQRFLCDNSIPSAYGNTDSASIVFGENAKYIGESILKSGVILDAPAAEHLMNRGINVGIESITACETPDKEHYLSDDEYVCLSGGKFFDIKIRSGAKVLTEFHTGNGRTFSGAFEYMNTDGYRFLVYPFDAYASRGGSSGLFRSYCRQRQLIGSIAWLQERSLDAVCPGNPDLYVLCKKDLESLSVGLWNFFADIIYSPEIYLADNYKSIEYINCGGRLEGNKVILSDIPAFGFAGFEVKY